jgi:hypothetical protein
MHYTGDGHVLAVEQRGCAIYEPCKTVRSAAGSGRARRLINALTASSPRLARPAPAETRHQRASVEGNLTSASSISRMRRPSANGSRCSKILNWFSSGSHVVPRKDLLSSHSRR